MKKAFFNVVAVLIIALLGLPISGWAADFPINTDMNGVAIKGYDTVAYFTESRPVKGNPDISYEWRGAIWQFASEQHRELFKGDPEKYAPQYGGY